MGNTGRYIYGVAASARAISLGAIGIEGREVYTIPYGGLCAIVHTCAAEPYQCGDEETVKEWVRTHQGVLDDAKKELGTIIPMGFDTILRSEDDAVFPDQVVQNWLKEDSERLQSLIEKMKGMDEYGVQVFYTPSAIAKRVSEESQEIQRIKQEMSGKSAGTAYLLRHKVEGAVQAEMERLANEWFKDFYGRIKHHCSDTVVEKTKKVGGNEVMLLNLSCLVASDRVDNLGEELEGINNMQGLSVHFSGPWPPYGFVAKPVVPVQEEVK